MISARRPPVSIEQRFANAERVAQQNANLTCARNPAACSSDHGGVSLSHVMRPPDLGPLRQITARA